MNQAKAHESSADARRKPRHYTRTCEQCGTLASCVEDCDGLMTCSACRCDEDERAVARTAAGFRRHAEHEAARAYALLSSSDAGAKR